MVLRIQLERQRQGRLPSLREYAQLYGLTRERVELARPDVLIMHPGPINRGVEITQEVADGPGSVILEQVTNGVAVRMAVLFRASGLDPGALVEEAGTGEEKSGAAIPGETEVRREEPPRTNGKSGRKGRSPALTTGGARGAGSAGGESHD
jgi:hypothetical protein